MHTFFSNLSKFIPHLSRPAQLCLLYGEYLVLCHMLCLCLFILLQPSEIPTAVLAHRFLAWFEYPAMSLTLIWGGAAALDLAVRSAP